MALAASGCIGGGGGANQNPVASFRIATTTIAINKAIGFDASASYDPNGDELSYNWDFGDGGTGSGKTISHKYTAVGKFLVTLDVSDGRGGQDNASQYIEINHVPVAKMKITDLSGKAVTVGYSDSALAFDATGSTDSAGDIKSYFWDFGDGDTGFGAVVQHAYAKSGAYAVNLTVEDETGNSGYDSRTVTISYRAIYTGNISTTDMLGKDFTVPINSGSGSISITLAFNSSIDPGYSVPVPPPLPQPQPTGLASLGLELSSAGGDAVASAKCENDPAVVSLYGAGWKSCRISVPYRLIESFGYGDWIATVLPEPNLLSYVDVPYILSIIISPQKGGMLTMTCEGFVSSADSNPILNNTLNFPVEVVNGTYAISAILMFDSGVIGGVPMGYLINNLDLYIFDNEGKVVAFSNRSVTNLPVPNPANITFTYQMESAIYYAKTINGLTPGQWNVGISLVQGIRVQYWLTITATYSTK